MYFTDPTNIFLVMYHRNALQAEDFFRGYVLSIVTGSRYLGGFMGSKSAQDR